MPGYLFIGSAEAANSMALFAWTDNECSFLELSGTGFSLSNVNSCSFLLTFVSRSFSFQTKLVSATLLSYTECCSDDASEPYRNVIFDNNGIYLFVFNLEQAKTPDRCPNKKEKKKKIKALHVHKLFLRKLYLRERDTRGMMKLLHSYLPRPNSGTAPSPTCIPPSTTHVQPLKSCPRAPHVRIYPPKKGNNECAIQIIKNEAFTDATTQKQMEKAESIPIDAEKIRCEFFNFLRSKRSAEGKI